jgi:hypothetical protein
MPLLTLGTTYTPPLPPPPPGGGGTTTNIITPPVSVQEDVAPPVIYWTAADGSITYLLGGAGYRLLKGARGLDMAPFQMYLDESPALDGAFSRGVRAMTRDVFLPLLIEADDRKTFLARKRILLRLLDPKRGPGVLTWAEPDGTARHLEAYYSSGMEGDWSDDQAAGLWQKYGLTLQAVAPYWYGDDVTLLWKNTVSQTFFPLVHASGNFVVLPPGEVLGSITASNDGDVDAFPVWTVSGPASAITLTNSTTGKTLSLTSSLAGSSNKRIIDTRAGVQTIVNESGTNKWAEVNDGSALWQLAPGANSLTVSVTGSGTGTSVQLVYKPRYEGV